MTTYLEAISKRYTEIMESNPTPRSWVMGRFTRSYYELVYEALAGVLHTDRGTAKRWYHAWCYGASSRTLFHILQDDASPACGKWCYQDDRGWHFIVQ